MKKRLLSMLCCLSMLLALVPAVSLPAAASTNGHTRAEAVAWMNQQLGNYLDYDGVYGAQCVDLIKYYYAYLGNGGYAMGNACDYTGNAIPSGWTRVYSNPQPGDVIVWGAYTKDSANWTLGEFGHIGLVAAVNGGSLTTVEQNISGSPCRTANREASYATCFIRPDFASDRFLTINHNVNGGKLNSTEFKVNAAGIVQKDGKDATSTWAYGSGGQYGLWNAASFGLTREGYTFFGWCLSPDGTGHIFDQDDTSLKAEDIYPKVKDGSASVTLYAIWQPEDTAVYVISPKCAPDSCLDVQGAGKNNGANVLIWPYEGSKNQQWAIVPVEDGWYKFVPQHSPKALDLVNFGNTSGTNVQQYVYEHQYDQQKWKLEEAGDGYYYIIPKANTGLCLDVYNADSANGTNVWVYSRNETDAQKWKLTLVSGTPDASSPLGHVHSYEIKVTKPTCTTDGYTTYTCHDCGDEYRDNTVPALGHDFVNGVCTRCGEIDEDYVIDQPKPANVITLQIGNPIITVNGVEMPIDVQGTTPRAINNRTLLPIRAVIESMGGTVGWEGSTKTVTLKKDGKTLYLRINTNFCWDDSGSRIPLDSPPIAINGRTLLPIRAVVEYFGATVEWDGATSTVTIRY